MSYMFTQESEQEKSLPFSLVSQPMIYVQDIDLYHPRHPPMTTLEKRERERDEEQYCFHNYTDQSRRARHNDW